MREKFPIKSNPSTWRGCHCFTVTFPADDLFENRITVKKNCFIFVRYFVFAKFCEGALDEFTKLDTPKMDDTIHVKYMDSQNLVLAKKAGSR